jgi:hypothetical protein
MESQLVLVHEVNSEVKAYGMVAYGKGAVMAHLQGVYGVTMAFWIGH